MNISDKAFNRSPSVIQQEQEQELYSKLYPKAIGDFYHKEDVDIYIKQLNNELIALNNAINSLAAQVNSALNTLVVEINAAIASHSHLTPVPAPSGVIPAKSVSVIPGSSVMNQKVVYSGNITRLKINDVKANALVVSEKSKLDNVPQTKRKGTASINPPFSLDSV